MELNAFYEVLVKESTTAIYRTGQWGMFQCSPVGNNGGGGFEHVVAYGWCLGDDYRLIVLNLSGESVSAMIEMDYWQEILSPHRWQATDVLNGVSINFNGDEVGELGLPIEMEGYDAFIFRLVPVGTAAKRKQRKRQTA